MLKIILLIITINLHSLASYGNLEESSMLYSKNDSFVHLNSVNSSIQVSLRYFKSDNPMGRPLKGYLREVVFITSDAARALNSVQIECEQRGYSLVVYDGFKPEKAVADMLEWAGDSEQQQVNNNYYYPNFSKKDLLHLGYFDDLYNYSRGSTVDVTIIEKTKKVKLLNITQRTLKNGEEIFYLDDGTIDMGTSCYFFDPASSHNASIISNEAIKNRAFLKELMIKHGFKSHDKFWWQYTLAVEPYPDSRFNFDIN